MVNMKLATGLLLIRNATTTEIFTATLTLLRPLTDQGSEEKEKPMRDSSFML
uniref:Uncharacterized protein n=1 Tax=Arundo donax TaxID=35708 RepID=A0A0A9ATM2_ARUDO